MYLFAGSLFPGNKFANFSELPILIEHYVYHRTTETPGLTFLEFMSMHYFDVEHEKSDATHHNKLPLHHPSTTMAVNEIVYGGFYDKLFNIFLPEQIVLNFTYNVFFPTAVSKGIFHPPKV